MTLSINSTATHVPYISVDLGNTPESHFTVDRVREIVGYTFMLPLENLIPYTPIDNFKSIQKSWSSSHHHTEQGPLEYRTRNRLAFDVLGKLSVNPDITHPTIVKDLTNNVRYLGEESRWKALLNISDHLKPVDYYMSGKGL